MPRDAVLGRADRPVLRRCDSNSCCCDADEQLTLRRDGDGAARDLAPPIVNDVLRAAGEELEPGARIELESGFGRDFSHIRVHTDSRAAASATAVGARAYTVGPDIAFAAGMYAPHTAAGRRLLAHELTHVVQQGGHRRADLSGLTVGSRDAPEEHRAARGAADIRVAAQVPVGAVAAPAVRRAEGTAVVADTLSDMVSGGRRWRGTMIRTQYRTQAEADAARRGAHPPVMEKSSVRVAFDGNTCEVTVPVAVQIRAATAADTASGPSAAGSAVAAAVDPGLVNSVGAAYIAACNVELNGWYDVELRDCAGEPCAGRHMPIRVVVTQTTTNPDFVVCVSGGDRRSFVQQGSPGKVVLFARGLEGKTLAHEGGHMALGAPDEYHEDDPTLRKKWPLQKGPEREHTDDTLMGSAEGGEKWLRLHERHFSFVTAFLQLAMVDAGRPNCQAVLHELERPVPLDYHAVFGTAYASRGGSEYFDFSLGLDVGRPLERNRRWQAFLGVHGSLLLPLSPDGRTAFLAGARIGLEYRFSPASRGLQLGAFGEAGGSAEIGTQARPLTPYVGAGARLGLSVPTARMDVGIEAMRGMDLDAEHQRWFRLGLYLGGRF